MKLSFRKALLASLISCSFPLFAAPAGDLPLMPWPQEVSVLENHLELNPQVKIVVDGDQMDSSIILWRNRIEAQTGWILPPQSTASPSDVIIHIIIKNKVHEIPQPDSDESYELRVDDRKAEIKANSRFGAMRGMETLFQLLQNDGAGVSLPAVTIKDAPRFSWRGLMIDSARHFIPITDIKRQIDGIAAAKMNVFHWHLTDDQGWRFASDLYPRLQELASDGYFYSKKEMKDVVAYATKLGVRVVPEVDLPGHASTIAVAYPEFVSAPGSYEMQRHWGVHVPTLDPSNPEVYVFVDRLVSELTEVFPDPYLHIGGDEVNPAQWNESAKIQAFMKENNLADAHALQAYFNKKLEEILSKYLRRVVGWDEIYHPDLPNTIMIQSWQGQDSLAATAQDNYQGILSTGFYLDQPHDTTYHYRNEPLPQPLNVSDQIAEAEKAQSWSFSMPRLRGSAVNGSFTLIEGKNGWRGFIDFDGKSRRGVSQIDWGTTQDVSFSVDTWMGKTSPVVKLNQDTGKLAGYILVGNVRYPITGEKLNEVPKGKAPVMPEASKMVNIRGGEAALWGENVTKEVLDLKLWPRTFAVAERLWSAKDVNEEQNMYQRLKAIDSWSVVSVGLKQHAASARLMTRLANSTDIEALQIFAEAVEPAHYYTRNHAKSQAENYHQYEPLNRFADALGPESHIVREMDNLVGRIIKDNKDIDAIEQLEARFIRWQNNTIPLMEKIGGNYRLHELREVANDVLLISSLGLQLLEMVKSDQRLDEDQYQPLMDVLNKAAQMRDEVVIRAVYPLERLLKALTE